MSQQFKLKLDLTEEGFNIFLKPYQRVVLELIWNHPEGLSTREVWNLTSMEMTQKISKASIIIFLANLVEYQIIEYRLAEKEGNTRYLWYINDKNQLTNLLERINNKMIKTLNN